MSEHEEIVTKADYRAKYPNATVCPDCDADDQCMVDGVCFYCVCGCDWCEAGRPESLMEAITHELVEPDMPPLVVVEEHHVHVALPTDILCRHCSVVYRSNRMHVCEDRE